MTARVRWWRRTPPEPPVRVLGPLGEPQPGRDAVRAVSAMVGSEGDELARVLDEAMSRHPEAFVLSLVQLAAALALSSPDDAAAPGSLAWWALRHEVVVARSGAR